MATCSSVCEIDATIVNESLSPFEQQQKESLEQLKDLEVFTLFSENVQNLLISFIQEKEICELEDFDYCGIEDLIEHGIPRIQATKFITKLVRRRYIKQ